MEINIQSTSSNVSAVVFPCLIGNALQPSNSYNSLLKLTKAMKWWFISSKSAFVWPSHAISLCKAAKAVSASNSLPRSSVDNGRAASRYFFRIPLLSSSTLDAQKIEEKNVNKVKCSHCKNRKLLCVCDAMNKRNGSTSVTNALLHVEQSFGNRRWISQQFFILYFTIVSKLGIVIKMYWLVAQFISVRCHY